MTTKTIPVVKEILNANDQVALENSKTFSQNNIFVLNLMASPGAGKTSLIRATLGLAHTGRQASIHYDTCRIGDTSLPELTATARARRVSYLPQTRPLAWPTRVRDLVALGRFAYGVSVQTLTGTDADAVDRALTACDLHPLAERRADTLSGGELARVHVARALAAEAPLLIADEPVAALDPYAQFQTMDLIRSFVDQGGGALVILLGELLTVDGDDHRGVGRDAVRSLHGQAAGSQPDLDPGLDHPAGTD